MIAAYREPDRASGRQLMSKVIEPLSHGVPSALGGVITLGRTLKKRAADVLADFDRPGTSNGPTRAINGRLEHLRGYALGFRNLTNFIARSLLETGGFRPHLHSDRESPIGAAGRIGPLGNTGATPVPRLPPVMAGCGGEVELAPVPADPGRARLRPADRGPLRADAAGAAPGDGVPLRPGASGDRPAAPGAALGESRGVHPRSGAGRHGHRLRRARRHPADHDGRHHRPHPVPGVRDVARTRAARRAPAADLDAYFATADLTPPTERTVCDEPALRELLTAVRERGWACADEELAPGLRSIAAPVRDRGGRVVAAINVSSTTGHDPVAEFVGPLTETAAAISADLAEAPR